MALAVAEATRSQPGQPDPRNVQPQRSMGSLCSRRAHWQEEDSRRAHWQEEDGPPVPKAPRYAGNGRFWSPRGTRLRPSTFGSDEFVADEFDPNSYRTGQFIVDDDDGDQE